ncbi:hypothetical protein NDU88_007731 [Pleurodeles waltl]|uniref:Uncharacterized protein n=1 Tax=Pleurodeles waltl TaxID=8319 RepID=A0AAV7N530_PLEWA|nr:hypothetical protein NDU88_007731 [Pleurodeles waltl]
MDPVGDPDWHRSYQPSLTPVPTIPASPAPMDGAIPIFIADSDTEQDGLHMMLTLMPTGTLSPMSDPEPLSYGRSYAEE